MVAWVCCGLAQEEQEGKGHRHGPNRGEYLGEESSGGAEGPRPPLRLPGSPSVPPAALPKPLPWLLLSEENSSIWGELLFT